MPRKPKQEQLLSMEAPDVGKLELHVTGDLLPISTYNKILTAIDDNRKGKALPILFVAYSLNMYLSLRESIPKEYFSGIELRDTPPALDAGGHGGLRDAAGM